jgi:outer membrane protein
MFFGFAAGLLLLQIAPAPIPPEAMISLEDAWRAGLRGSFTLADARDSVRAASILEFDAKSRFFPKVTPSYFKGPTDHGWSIEASQTLPWLGGELRAQRTTRTFDGVDSPAVQLNDTSFTWSQPLLRGAGPNASLYELRNARRFRESQERALVLSKQRLMIEIARAYYQVIAQRDLLDVARQSAARSEGLRKASEARMDVGLSNKLDVYRAQLSESQAEQAAVQAETSFQSALERFRYLLGRPPHDLLVPAPLLLESPASKPDRDVESLVAMALDRRLELLEANAQIDDAKRTASLSRQNLLPDMSLNVRYTDVHATSPIGPFPSDTRRWESFFSASLPIERAADISRLQLSNLDVRARERAYLQRRYDVESDVRAAHREVERLSRSIATQQTAVSVADQQLELANLRYQRGLASNFDVVDAEGSLLGARGSLVQLLAAYRVALLDLDRAVGTLSVPQESAS